MGTEAREELKAKQLEKVIYFAANLVTWVDEEQRHEDLPNLEAEMIGEREAIEKERELELARRHEELEKEIAELEKRRRQGLRDQGPPARRREGPRRHPRALRRWSSTSLVRAFDEFKDLFARKIIEDEMLWRELHDRYGEYFEGGMGADAIERLIDRIDLDEEEVKLRVADRPAGGPEAAVGPAQAEGHQAAEDRRRRSTAATRTAAGSTTRGP